MIDVSVIIVNYNGSHLLKTCLESIRRFTKDISYEIIVVDNNSTDNFSEVIDKFPDVKTIRNSENFGFAKANNQGAAIAEGKYLILLNNDTCLIENSFKILLDFYESSRGEKIIGPVLINTDQSIQPSAYKFPSPSNLFISNLFFYRLLKKGKLNKNYGLPYKNFEQKYYVVDSVIGACIFISFFHFEKLNGFDERFFFYHEDTDLCYRFMKQFGEVIYLTNTSIIHYGGATTKNILWFHYKNRSSSLIKFLQKHVIGTKFIVSVILHYLGILVRIPIFLMLGIFTFNPKLIKRFYYYLRLLFFYPKNVFD